MLRQSVSVERTEILDGTIDIALIWELRLDGISSGELIAGVCKSDLLLVR